MRLKICKHGDGCGYCLLHDEYCPESPCPNEELIDYEPVKHAKWDTVFYQRFEHELASYAHCCPECKFMYRDLRMKGYNYCPNCGAKMDLEG